MSIEGGLSGSPFFVSLESASSFTSAGISS